MGTRHDDGLERRTVLGMAVAVPAAASAGTLGATLMSAAAGAAATEGNWTATEVVAHIKAGDISAENYCKQAIKAYQDRKRLNAITWIDEAKLLEAAIYNAPGISLPAGLTRRGLPVGLELDGWAGGDESLLSLGRRAEAVLGILPPPA